MNSDWEDYNQLMKALRQGKKEEVKRLLLNEARVNMIPQVEKVCTPLHLAVTLGCPEIVKLLLDRNANVNAKDANLETPLTMAAKMGRNSIVDYLLPLADEENYCDYENFSTMHIACMRNQVDIVKKLVQNGAKLNHTVNANALIWPGFTPLHFAAQYQSIETVAFLISCGADISAQDAKTLTPLHYADIVRNETIIDLILSVHQYKILNPVNSQGLSHFHIACTRNNPAIVESFLLQGVDIDFEVNTSSLKMLFWKPIDFAIYYECTDVLQLLLSYKACVNKKFVLYAYRRANKEIINTLMSKETIKKFKIEPTNAEIIKKLKDFNEACIEEDLDEIQKLVHEMSTRKFWYLESSLCINRTPLHVAIQNKCIKAVKKLLKHDANVIILKDVYGKTSLHLAFETEQWSMVNIILSAHEQVFENPINNEGLSHFHIACTRNNLKLVEIFLKMGVNINDSVHSDAAFWPGYTALHFASAFKRTAVIKLLLKHDADITIKNEFGLTCLDIAINSIGSTRFWFTTTFTDEWDIIYSILSHLLEQQRSFNTKFDSFNDRGFTLLHVACSISETEYLESILDAYPENINKTINWVESKWSGFTPLHFAAFFENEKAARILFNKGANNSIKDGRGDTPLHVAFNQYEDDGFGFKYIDELRYKFIFSKDNPIGSRGYSHFHIACLRGKVKAIEYFLYRGVDVNKSTIDESRKKPLHLAVDNEYQNSQVVQILMKHGADVNARDAELNTPLHCTNFNKYSNIIKILLNENVNVNALNIYNETPLFRICETQIDVAIIELLLQYGADINIANHNGKFPFSMLSSSHHVGNTFKSVIMRHIKRLKIINYYIKKENEEIYHDLLIDAQDRGYYKEDEFSEQCLKELQQMLNVHIDNYTRLRDILYKDSHYMALRSQNITVQNIINSEDLLDMFPIYGFLLKLQLKKGLIRKALLDSSKISLIFLANTPLPDACLENILFYIDDDDLQNIIKSTENS